MKQTNWTAHSGADGTLDNSLQFVRYALGTQADALEVDIRRHPCTGELVLGHDTVGEHPLTLREVFEQAGRHPSMKINCDLKEPALERQVLTLAQQSGMTDRLILSGTVDVAHIPDAAFRAQQVYWNLEEQIPGYEEQCLRNPVFRLEAMKQMCRLCREADVQVINVYEGFVDREVLDMVRRHQLKLSVWTVNTVSRMAWFRDQGVHNITTRRIAQALALPPQHETKAVCLLEQAYQWSSQDTSSDVVFSFQCPAEVEELVVSFTYSPGEEATREICLPAVQAAVTRYYGGYPQEIEPMTAEQFLPVKNLITLSLAREGVYLGNAHRWAPEQEHVISCRYASSGFCCPVSMAGAWTGMLHLHEVLSPVCKGHLRIEGRTR
ncbi:MAG: glycerophosphodiester phosphodiesterase [Butyricicoccus sp.]